MNKNFNKILAAALAAAVSLRADSVVRGETYALSHIRMPNHFHEGYSVIGGGLGGAKMENKERDDAFGGCFYGSAGFEWMNDGDRGATKLGQGFSGTQNTNVWTLTDSSKNFLARWYPRSTGSTDINPWTTTAAGGSTPAGTYGENTVTFKPKNNRFFVDLGYNHCLDNFYEGLHFGVSLAFVGVENQLNAVFDQKTAASAAPGTASGASNYGLLAGTASIVSVANIANFNSTLNNGLTLKEVLAGDKAATEHAVNAQDHVKHGKFTNHSREYGVDGVKAHLGVKMVNTENFHACLRILGFIPLGKDRNHETLFQPEVGEINYKIGAAGMAHACLAEGVEYKIGLDLYAEWLYSFPRSGSDKGWRIPSHSKIDHGVFALAVKSDHDPSAVKYFSPLVNLLRDDSTISFEFKPRHEFNLAAALCMEKGCFFGSLSYALQYRVKEDNDGKIAENSYYFVSDLVTSAKENGTTAVSGTNNYVVASPNYVTKTDKSKVTAVAPADLIWSDKEQITHRLALNLGMCCRDWQYPATFSLTGGYRFAHHRTRTAEHWFVGVRGGVCF